MRARVRALSPLVASSASAPPPPNARLSLHHHHDHRPIITPTTKQVQSFYESVGLMVGAEADPAKREEYLARLMAPPNAIWAAILAQAAASPEVLKQQEVIKSIQVEG